MLTSFGAISAPAARRPRSSSFTSSLYGAEETTFTEGVPAGRVSLSRRWKPQAVRVVARTRASRSLVMGTVWGSRLGAATGG
ncbi:hypothetical protein A6R79_09945 [Xanthomonas translucens pv. translucens]|nr:hypothetical protein A6R79_09945 [Xanthomonas translucens pv. translucens]